MITITKTETKTKVNNIIYYNAVKKLDRMIAEKMEETSDELMALLKKPLKCDVKLQRQLGRMPRKMKKAHRSDYPRNTKWNRKVTNYLRRMTIYLRNGELVVTEEQFNCLSVTISGSKVQ